MHNLILAIGIGLIILILFSWSLRHEIKPYFARKELLQWVAKHPDAAKLTSTYHLFNDLYSDVRGRSISNRARARLKLTSQEFIYGEIEFLSFIFILEQINIKPGEVFYDLGSGAGKAVFAAALYYDFAKCYGIELLSELHRTALAQIERFKDLIKTQDKNFIDYYENKINNIEFINANILETDFSDADVIFINATCFLPETWTAIENKFLNLKAGTRIIVTTQTIYPSEFKLLSHQKILMSWGMNQIRCYIKTH